MSSSDLAAHMKELRQFAKAKSPIEHTLLKKIPYFESIFSDEELWKVLVRISGDDGIAHFEHKKFEEGQKLISKGQFDQMIYWVLKGKALIISEIKGHPKVIHEARKGECIGELGVLRGVIRTADVVDGKGGVEVLELDWALTDKCTALGKNLYHLIALHLADKLDGAYDKQLKIIANSITILHEKTSQLIERNRELEKYLMEHSLIFEQAKEMDHEEALCKAIASIKESLSLLKIKENQNNLDKIGVV